jgi:phosphoribosyl 1,2-cyclic phosphodiesterase
MGFRLSVLASGSKGNCLVVSSSSTSLLVDCGLSCRETLNRMRQAGEDPERLDAVLITHEHSDHVRGLEVLARKLGLSVFLTEPTASAYRRWFRASQGEKPRLDRVETFTAGHPFQVGDIAVTPFTIPHDAADPVGFVFRTEGLKVGLVTDLGYMPPNVRHQLRGCDGVVVESNHDLEMLRSGPYPWAVKQRVMSRVGHLSNQTLADFFLNDYDGGAAFVVLAHLSEQNNHPEIARRTAEQALAGRRSLLHNRLFLAAQAQPLEPIRL